MSIFKKFGKNSSEGGSKWTSLAAAMKVEATAFSARARRSLPPGGMQALQESVKEKQTKAKEAREARQKLIGPEHKYILTLIPRIFISNCSSTKLTGTLIYFIKSKLTVELQDPIAANEVFMGVLDTANPANGEGLFSIVEQYMQSCVYPPVRATKDWGLILKEPGGSEVHANFLGNLENFMLFLAGAQISISHAVTLAPDTIVNWADIHTMADCQYISSNPDTVVEIENLVTVWCKQLEKILAESERMRKEADDTGPRAELDHWRQMSSRFSSLVEQVKGNRCRMAINILHIVKSKVLRKWKGLDDRITDGANEAKDNIKLLDVFEMFSPLSDAKIEGIEPHAARFSQIVAGLKKKPYNLLDQKNLTFDADFGEFMQVVSELQVTLLVRTADNRKLLINFDPQLLTSMKEAEFMMKNMFEVPNSCKTLLFARNKLKGYLEKLELLLTENEALRADIPLQFRPVMTAALDRVDLAIRPGLITIGWSCLGVEPYFANVTAALDQLRQLTKVIEDAVYDLIRIFYTDAGFEDEAEVVSSNTIRPRSVSYKNADDNRTYV
ncbi:DNAH8 [Bugula neritina]|uniref:DNAH8 n=1 Tax=Bugula neritina TaxID=10212 RepID=A0A7J7J130_BUGNE|nr:DNAH8 [Bugula neritina]